MGAYVAGVFPSQVQELLDAADRERSEGRRDRAIDLYSEALELLDDEPYRRRIRLRRGLTLVEHERLEEGSAELDAIVDDLEGREAIEGCLGLGQVSMWLEQTDKALTFAERAVDLSDALGDDEMRGPALAILSQVYGQRGEEGDLGRALEMGDRALQIWLPGTSASYRSSHESLQGLAHYWAGNYELGAELARGDGASESLSLVALGRHEEAIGRSDAGISQARQSGSAIATAYALNCSTAALRDLMDLDEARRRNVEAAELFGGVGFESGVMQSEIDLLYADLAVGDAERAERAWPALWERVGDATGWERWLAPGRLSVARAEIAVRLKRWQEATEAALEAIEIARRIRREKYDVSARIALGIAHLELGRPAEAVDELTKAVEGADRLRHPPTRWQAHAALARALHAVDDDEGANVAASTARECVEAFASSLEPDHAEALIASVPVKEILGAL